MDAADHSSLIFLLSAIEAAPGKSADLLAIAARRPHASDEFRCRLGELVAVVNDERQLLASSEALRKQLR